MKVSLNIRIILFVAVTLVNKILFPPNILFADIYSARYFLNLFFIVSLIVESILLVNVVYIVFKKSHTILSITTMLFFFLLDSYITYKVFDTKIENEINKYGVIVYAVVNDVRNTKGKVYYQLQYKYGTQDYKTPYIRSYNKTRNDVGDTIIINVSKRDPYIFTQQNR